MATQSPTFNNLAGQADGSALLVTWVLTTANNVGIAIELPEWADKTATVGETGDVYGAGTVTVEGSNNGTDFVTLNKANQGTAGLSYTTGNNLAGVIENPRFVRAVLTGSTAAS